MRQRRFILTDVILSDLLTSTDYVSWSANDGVSGDETPTDDGTTGRCPSQSTCRHARMQTEGFVDNAIEMRQLT